MANEISFELGTTGATVYAVARNAAGQAWNGAAFATYTTTRGDFDLAMTELGVTGFYGPIDAPDGTDWWQIYKQVAGSPSHSNDELYATGYPDTGLAILDAIEDIEVGGGGVSGPGADQVTIGITQDDNPVPDADVWISSDAAGAHVVAGTLQTNSQGEATFLLDDGVTYYIWMQKDGFNSIQGEEFEAVAD